MRSIMTVEAGYAGGYIFIKNIPSTHLVELRDKIDLLISEMLNTKVFKEPENPTKQ